MLLCYIPAFLYVNWLFINWKSSATCWKKHWYPLQVSVVPGIVYRWWKTMHALGDIQKLISSLTDNVLCVKLYHFIRSLNDSSAVSVGDLDNMSADNEVPGLLASDHISSLLEPSHLSDSVESDHNCSTADRYLRMQWLLLHMLIGDSPVCLCTVIHCQSEKVSQHPTSVKFSPETLELLFNWRKVALWLTQVSISCWLSISFQAMLKSFQARHTQITSNHISGHGWRNTMAWFILSITVVLVANSVSSLLLIEMLQLPVIVLWLIGP